MGVDVIVALFTLRVSIATGLAFGLVPALQAASRRRHRRSASPAAAPGAVAPAAACGPRSSRRLRWPYAVTPQLREISIRMALGARTLGVVRMIVGQAIQSQLYGVTVFDPLTLAGVTAILAASAALASFLPARRAAGLDPAGVLRQG
jgi:ABC-type antimicrobial peptide transport system permease subunit